MDEWTGLVAALRTGGWIMYPLSLLGVLALTIIFERAYVFARFARAPAALLEPDTSDTPDMPAQTADGVERLATQHAFRRMAAAWRPDATTPLWLREASAQAIAARIERDMSRGLWLLETIVTAAPLLGLLGTIVGMMQSFKLFGGDGLVDPAGVTGGVAQALVATAVGLIVAVFALFAFNYFSRRLERLMDELELFANARLNALRARDETSGA
ncbi:MotA/TolQ/ExbB proton channel family protein [Paraburkholderia sp. MMS20-SJTR3]|uniref:MotA/TolQ/ExbB proton channel family protein n=1 Tax=Paraburkholderia sejongensis TaxID=2886946 RepID=A0ABS8JT02_9BURK|nr:MotA/TolQ/ExbB proton channel family protein [Paraburkholderia sp. MMS20-SJTR3]MCC8393016.1 MotA/TolQ/ExbB proton channel family protein [Paraburkholderia sp. MMS20-SJTR3]